MQITVPCPSSERGRRPHSYSSATWPPSRRKEVPSNSAWDYGQDYQSGPPDRASYKASLTPANMLRHFPQTPHHGDYSPAMDQAHPRTTRYGLSSHRVDTDALWRSYCNGILPRRQPRPMRSALHHGLSIHRLCYYLGHHVESRRQLAQEDGLQPGNARLVSHYGVGYHQYLYGTPWRTLDAQGYAAHHDGSTLVGWRDAGYLPQSQGTAVVRACCHYSHDWLGHVCA